MARQRRNISEANKIEKSTNSSSSNGSNSSKHKKSTNGSIPYWKHVIGFICFTVAVVVCFMGYLETRVNTPFDHKKVCIDLKFLLL